MARWTTEQMVAYNRVRVAKLKAAGICYSCGQVPVTTKKLCDRCRKRQPEYTAKRTAAGKCISCRNDKLPAHKMCGECRERKRLWKLANIDDIHRKNREKRRSDRAIVIAHYGGCCACCGESTPEFMNMDHINGGGRLDKRKPLRGSWWRIVIKLGFPDDLRLLCFNCNIARGLFGKCPHGNC